MWSRTFRILTNYTNLAYPFPLESFTPQCSKIQKKECNFWEFVFGQSGMCTTFILFVTSIHQTKNIVFPIFFHEFFSVWPDEKENELFIGPKLRKKICYGPVKSLFLFQLLKLRKFRGKNWGKQDSWFGGFMSRTRYVLHFFSNCRALCSAPKYYFLSLVLKAEQSVWHNLRVSRSMDA